MTVPVNTPVVSFLCPTYGRAPRELHLLEEKAYWFSRQDYPAGRRELLVLNDAPGQTLACDVPGVRVVNYPYRFSSLGEKMNALIALARGDILVPDEDDDISLPNRCRNAAAALRDRDFFDPTARFFQNGKGVPLTADPKNYTHHACCYRRGAVCYPPAKGNQDAVVTGWKRWEARIDERVQFGPAPKPSDLDYVYRWGRSLNHLSGNPDMARAWDAVPVPVPGAWRIEPRMGEDYVALAARAVEKCGDSYQEAT